MERDCPLCGNPHVETKARWTWPLPGMDDEELGFGLCPTCGLVQQRPCSTAEAMARYYALQAVYTNPGRGGEPRPIKVQGTRRLVELVRQTLGRMPASLFQVGCSDGYSLHCFREAGVEQVRGIDPSAASRDFARERYGIDYDLGTFEDLSELPEVELWLMTHVLEHLHDPLATLQRIHASQSDGGWVLVEVPLFDRPELLPPGYLSFEHLNYFTEPTLVRMLRTAGYDPREIYRDYHGDIYPIVGALARRCEPVAAEDPAGAEVERALVTLETHLRDEAARWKRIEARVFEQIDEGTEVHIWGAGIHTSQLLAFTGLQERLSIQGLIDSAPLKWGTTLGRHKCVSPQDVDLSEGTTVILSSFAAEAEIYDSLASARDRGLTAVRLYG
jgi:SAM-dependent methyltransferase